MTFMLNWYDDITYEVQILTSGNTLMFHANYNQEIISSYSSTVVKSHILEDFTREITKVLKQNKVKISLLLNKFLIQTLGNKYLPHLYYVTN